MAQVVVLVLVMVTLVSINANDLVLFLDFRKAFDSISHKSMLHILQHIGLPSEFVSWVEIMYLSALSMVCHKNWLTPTFVMEMGVHQGCPLSCHLFNLVGQLQIYSLHQ